MIPIRKPATMLELLSMAADVERAARRMRMRLERQVFHLRPCIVCGAKCAAGGFGVDLDSKKKPQRFRVTYECPFHGSFTRTEKSR